MFSEVSYRLSVLFHLELPSFVLSLSDSCTPMFYVLSFHLFSVLVCGDSFGTEYSYSANLSSVGWQCTSNVFGRNTDENGWQSPPSLGCSAILICPTTFCLLPIIFQEL